MRRSESPWTGVGPVMMKELSDHLTGARLSVLQGLVLLTGFGAVYAAISSIRETVGEDPFLLLRLFTHAREPLPSFVTLLGFLVPLLAIALGFDSVNGEYNRRSMSRILAQPIYRDALLVGKFFAGLLTIAVALLALWLLVVGLGILLLGLPPSTAEVLRSLGFMAGTLAYGGVWLAVAMVFSVAFRAPATSALAALALWLLFAVFWPMVTPMLAQAFAPAGSVGMLMSGQSVAQFELERSFARISPNTLYGEIAIALLNPGTRTLGPVFFAQLQGAILGSPLPFGQSLLLVWPQFTGLVAAVILLFTIGYVIFQRQEIRA